MSKPKAKEIEEDFLFEDPAINGQNYTCVSFVSPESQVEKRELYIMSKFFPTVVKDIVSNLIRTERQLGTTDEDLMLLENLVRENIEKYGLTERGLRNKLDDFKYVNEEKMTRDFNEKYDGATSIRGVKVRGVYDTYREAEIRSKVLHRKDPNFHIFVGRVGFWLPWDPNPDKIHSEYGENEKALNELVGGYLANQEQKDEIFEEDVSRRKAAAQAHNAQLRQDAQVAEDELNTLVQQELGVNINNNGAEAVIPPEMEVSDQPDISVRAPRRPDHIPNVEESVKKVKELRNLMKERDPWMERKMAEITDKLRDDNDNDD